MSPRRQLAPVFLLTLPILAFNLAFAGQLPAAYQPELFNRAPPPGLGLAENGLRLALFALTCLLPLRWHRVGLGLYLGGSAVYFAAWAALIAAPASAWSVSLPGFTAPAWTPALWLAGIGLMAAPPVFSPHPAWRRAFWLLAAAFLATHLGHATLVWAAL